ncbi:MAG: stage II sporulation protein P [Clostridiales bacterium]|nr:stage II sporulation protein P [Clostridiales bacterium]
MVTKVYMKDSGNSQNLIDQTNNGNEVYLRVFKKIGDPRNILAYQIPFLTGISDNESVETSASRGDQGERVMDVPEIFLKHEPDMSEEIKIEISKIKDDLGSITLTGEGPQILIYHTHSREAYRPDPDNPYKAVEAFRCDDLDYTVVKVGSVLARHLESKGISVLHDRTEHEQGEHATAYVRSLKTIQKHMKEHKSLKIFIDLHRNAYKEGVKSPDDEVVYINGDRVAKLFVVIGTGQGYVGGFSERPNWKENYKFAMRLTNKVNELYPGLAKPVYVKPSRYNQHVSTKAILIEVGSNLTTLKEAERAAYYLAEAISQIVD